MSNKGAGEFVVLQMRLRLRVAPEGFLASSAKAADAIAMVDGLIWKVWLLDADRLEAGGVYLFASREAAEVYLDHPVTRAVRDHPDVVSTEPRIWEVDRGLSAVTRAPLSEMVAASAAEQGGM